MRANREMLMADVEKKLQELNEMQIYFMRVSESLKKTPKKITEIEHVNSPLNYKGNQFCELNQIMPLIPRNITTFVDLFAGGGVVGVNISADKIVLNDIKCPSMKVIERLQKCDVGLFIQKVLELHKFFKLSLINNDGYDALKKHYELVDQSAEVIFALQLASFNNDFRLDKNGDFSGGKSNIRKDYLISPPQSIDLMSKRTKKRLRSFSETLKKKNIEVLSLDYQDWDLTELDGDSFVYLNPPSLVNPNDRSWNHSSERSLYDYIDRLNVMGIRFMYVTISEYKGLTNNDLLDWSRKYNKIALNKEKFRNTQSKKVKELIITNYDVETFRMVK